MEHRGHAPRDARSRTRCRPRCHAPRTMQSSNAVCHAPCHALCNAAVQCAMHCAMRCALHLARLGGQRGDPEHLARPLAVRGRDQRRLHVAEPFALEELVRRLRSWYAPWYAPRNALCNAPWLYLLWLYLRVGRLREGGTHAGDGGDGVCPGAQVGDGAKELKRGLLLLDRVARSVAVQGEAHTCELQAGVCRLRSADWGLQTGVCRLGSAD